MKKLLYTLIVITSVCLFGTRCNKDEQIKQNNDQVTERQNTTDQTFENQIKAFKELIFGTYKIGGGISIDSAINYLEALVNYEYAAADSFYAFIFSDTARFYLEVNQEEQVTFEDVGDVYDIMIDSLEAIYDRIEDSYKHLVSADLIEISLSNNTLTMDLIPVFGINDNSYTYGIFGPTDYWYWGWNLGKCNGYTGEGDAAIQLEYRINHPLVQPTQQGYRVYYTDIVDTGWIYPWDYEDENYPGEWESYRLFSASGLGENPPEEPCICPNDLNYYLYDGLDYIIDDQQSNFPDLDFSYCFVYTDFIPADDMWFRFHYISIQYGVKHETIDPPSPL